jgi:hypothetical protein
MRELLSDVRTSSSEAHDCRPCVVQGVAAVRPQEALSLEIESMLVTYCFHVCLKGVPTIEKFSMSMGFAMPGYQHLPQAESSLKTIAP